MSSEYKLKLGATNFISEDCISGLSSSDEEKKNRAQIQLGERLKEIRIRIGTLLKTDNVSFLIGAGASIDAGGVGLSSIPFKLEEALINSEEYTDGQEPEWLVLFYEICSLLAHDTFGIRMRKTALAQNPREIKEIPINLEDFISHLYTWKASMLNNANKIVISFPEQVDLAVNVQQIDSLIFEIKRKLITLVDLPIKGKENALQDCQRLVQKVLTRPLNLRRVNLFTLNYDTLIEQAADAEGVILVDGFIGSLRRIFRPESYDVDFYFPAQTTEGRVHRLDRALHLYKLHGSITWHRCEENWENPYGLYATYYEKDGHEKDVLIYPSPLKYGQVLDLPYSELFRRFGSIITQPQSVLFTIGYGFGDDHVNAIIRQALSIPSFTLVVVDPSPVSQFVKHLEEIEDERIWLVNGSKLGTFKCFTDHLLPDLEDENITTKVVKTYKALSKDFHTESEENKGK